MTQGLGYHIRYAFHQFHDAYSHKTVAQVKPYSFQDGTIGDDIVVKPLSAQVRQVLNTRRMSAEDNAEEEERGGGGGGAGEGESGILADYVRSLREMQEQRPRHAFP